MCIIAQGVRSAFATVLFPGERRLVSETRVSPLRSPWRSVFWHVMPCNVAESYQCFGWKSSSFFRIRQWKFLLFAIDLCHLRKSVTQNCERNSRRILMHGMELTHRPQFYSRHFSLKPVLHSRKLTYQADNRLWSCAMGSSEKWIPENTEWHVVAITLYICILEVLGSNFGHRVFWLEDLRDIPQSHQAN